MKKWNYKFTVPEKKKIRIIVYTDAKNEADDQFAIAHHLMTDRFIVEGFVAGHFNGNPQEYGVGHTAQASMDEVNLVLDKMGLAGEYTVVKGSELPMVDEKTPQISDGAKFIIEQAMREDDDRPLFISCLGAITDLASAILMEPKICQRMTAVWIGGGVYPEGTGEFNMEQDIAAANVLFCSDMPVWQIPRNTYKQVSVTLGILQDRVEPCGELGKYLFDQLVAYNDKTAERMDWPHGETWGLGDSPTIGVHLFERECEDVYDMISAPRIDYETFKYIHNQGNREIRVYNDANARLLLEDFFSKLKINYGG